MKTPSVPFIRATLAMLGTIIGAGVFALPAAMRETGIVTGSVIYWAIALVVFATHLMYVEIIVRSPSMRAMRLPGQAGRLLGSWAGRLAYVSHPLQIIGACLAYLILGGEFLAVLAKSIGLPESVLLWQMVFWLGVAVTVFIGLKFVARVEAGMTWALIALLLICTAFFAARADASAFLEANWFRAFAPLGVFLFALFGLPVIPEVAAWCGHDARKTRLAVGIGSLLAAFLMWLFGIFGTAALGTSLSSNPASLAFGLPTEWFWLIPAVGFLAVATSFITLVQDLKAMLHLDAKLPALNAWAIALGAPFVLLLVVTRDFLTTVGFVGSIFGATNGLLVAFMMVEFGRRTTAALSLRWRVVLPFISIVVFLTAILWRIMGM